MDRVQQIQRLHLEDVPIKEIARRLGISRNSVKKYIRRLKDGPDAKELLLLSEAVYGSEQAEQSRRRYEDLLKFFAEASCELGRTVVTREVLWVEYMQKHTHGYSYSQFCHHLKRYESKSNLAMHLENKPGDLPMFDHAGKRMRIVSMDTGETTPCECFVSILPYSGPYIHVGSKVRVLFDEKTVEVYLDNSRIAFHERRNFEKRHKTTFKHMPPHHQHMRNNKGWTREEHSTSALTCQEFISSTQRQATRKHGSWEIRFLTCQNGWLGVEL